MLPLNEPLFHTTLIRRKIKRLAEIASSLHRDRLLN